MIVKTEKLKVAHLFIEGLSHSFENDYEFSFDEDANLMLARNENKLIDKLEESVWKEWVGSIEWESLKRSNAVLEIKRTSATSEIQDHESEELLNKLQTAWVALKLTAPVHTERSFKTCGYTIEEKLRVNHYEDLAKWYLPGYDEHHEGQVGIIEKIDESRLKQWRALYKTMRFLQSRRKDNEYLRVWLGLRSFEKACSEYYLEYRLPFFVRSLEALILPEQGKTANQFKSRVAKWWSKDINPKVFIGDSQKILGEIYDMRCDFDHLHGLKESYTSIQQLRAYQCEQLARRAYQGILLNEKDFLLFKDNEGVKQFWNK